MFRLTRVNVRLLSEPFGFSNIILLKPKGSERNLMMTRVSRNMSLYNHYNQLFVVLTVINRSNTRMDVVSWKIQV
jgi:hypothetical protein